MWASALRRVKTNTCFFISPPQQNNNDMTTPNRQRRPPPPLPPSTVVVQMPSQHQQQQLWQLAPMYQLDATGGYNVLQPYGWQQMPAGQGQPAQHQGALRNKKRRNNKRRQQHNNQAETGVPSLSSLRKENRAKARKYFAQGVCALG